MNILTLKSRFIINEHLAGVEKTSAKLKLDKPIFLGMAILDLSKSHMCQFFYDVLKKKYHEKNQISIYRY